MTKIKVLNFLVALCNILSFNFYGLAVRARDSGWLKVCENGENQAPYEIRSPVCSKGIWLSKPRALECICAKGVWILSNDFCDKKWTLVVGNGHCFQILDKVRSIKFIGKPDEPFASSTFTGAMDLANLVQISGGSYSNHINSEASVVIGINPKYPVQRIDTEICLGKGNQSKPVHIYRNAHGKFNQWRTLYNRDCSPLDYEYQLDMGELYRDGTVLPADIAIGKCQEMCLSSNNSVNNSQQGRIGRSLLSYLNMSMPTPPLIENMTETGKIRGRSAFATVVEVKPPFDVKPGTPGEKKLECLTNRAQVTQDPKQYEIETKEQTIRMIGAHLKPLLLNVTAFEVNTKEYEYFNTATKVFIKTCPGIKSDIGNVTKALSKMWGWLLWESHDKFTHMESPDEDTHTRILDTLVQCSNASSADLFINDKVVTPTPNPPPISCKRKEYSAIGTRYNGTANVTVNGTLPDYLKFDKEKHDLVIETAWKIILVMYYRCASFYVEKNATMELSYLMAKLQSFFNEKIVKRWTDSKDSWTIYSFILFAYDLEAYSENTDRCVVYSKELSEFPNWLLRPKVPCTENDLSSSRPKRSIQRENKLQKVWDASGYCINDFLDPVTKLKHRPSKGCSIQRKMKK